MPCASNVGLNSRGSLQEEIERFNRSRLEGPDGRQNAITLKGLSFIEAYLKDVLWIALKYRSEGAKVEKLSALALICHDRETANPAACFRPGVIDKIKPIYAHVRCSGDQDNVLVRDVELMEAVEAKIPSFVWLYVVEDSLDDSVAWRSSLLFASIDGTFKRLPIFPKREFAEFVEGSAVGICNDVVSVVQGGAEVVKCIAKDRGRVFGECRRPDGLPPFQKAVLALGSESLHVVTDVLPEDGFKLADVMFGPFNL
jgi:hypothetical protein